MDKPKPAPRRVDSALVVKNGSKMRDKFSGGIPQPKSRTETARYAALSAGAKYSAAGNLSNARVETTIFFCLSIASAALKTKFSRICWINSLTQVTWGRSV